MQQPPVGRLLLHQIRHERAFVRVCWTCDAENFSGNYSNMLKNCEFAEADIVGTSKKQIVP